MDTITNNSYKDEEEMLLFSVKICFTNTYYHKIYLARLIRGYNWVAIS